MLDINFRVVENFADESYGGFDGLVVEIGYLGGAVAGSSVGGTEHAGGNILGGEGTDGPAAVGVERGFGGADLLHEVGAESWSEEFGVVEFVGLREEGVVEGGGEVEEAVDHWTWNNQKVSQVPAYIKQIKLSEVKIISYQERDLDRLHRFPRHIRSSCLLGWLVGLQSGGYNFLPPALFRDGLKGR